MITRVVGYIRVSTEHQADGGVSLDAQRAELAAYAVAMDLELLKAIKARKDPPGAFRAWALAQSWPRFCTIVRIVSGEIRREVMRHGDQDEDEDDDPEA